MVDIPIRDRRAERREATRAEILATAWDLVREQGLGGLNLRDLPPRIGMRAPSLYEYFDSKHAVYDAMVAVDALSGEEGLRAMAHRAMAFMVEEPARYSLMFHRTIPGFTPSPESYAVSVEQLERARAWFARNDLGAPRGAGSVHLAGRPADRQRPRRRPLGPASGHRRGHVPDLHPGRRPSHHPPDRDATMTFTTTDVRDIPPIRHDEAMDLAAAEYQRFGALLRGLVSGDWRAGVPLRCGQRSEQIADAMTAVIASGWEISVRCDPPWKMVMWECARWAIESSEAAVMI
jgi:AcrR family transcriptional regulator